MKQTCADPRYLYRNSIRSFISNNYRIDLLSFLGTEPKFQVVINTNSEQIKFGIIDDETTSESFFDFILDVCKNDSKKFEEVLLVGASNFLTFLKQNYHSECFSKLVEYARCDYKDTLFEDLKPITSENEAQSFDNHVENLVNGPRQETYGHPFENFTDIGRMWGAILDIPDINPEKIALCMMATKIARLKNSYHEDGEIDYYGYEKCLQKVIERKKELNK